MPNPGYILRPVRESDFEELFQLIGSIGDSLTSLPWDSEYISHRIDDSLRAFDRRIRKPGGESYLFVLEELSSQKIIGTSGLLSRVGGFEPFYTYEVRRATQDYAPLDIHTELEELHLKKNHDGPTEICSLFLHEDFRSHGLGKLLSLPRFCFMKAFSERFDKTVIAEMRGFIDPKGKSPFWDAVGKKFFQNDYYIADILSGLGNKEFIEALMPEYPIYVTLLPESARQTIGKVHIHTEPAQAILLKEGFNMTNEVDIFDAGPILSANLEELSTWNESGLGTILEEEPDPSASGQFLLSNQSLDFRAVIAEAQILQTGEVVLTASVISSLNLSPGDQVMYLQLDTK